MPQTKSAAKELRKTKKRTAKNDVTRAGLDYLFRQFKKAVASNDTSKMEELAKQLTKAIDKAAQKKVLNKNTAARKKSRLMSKINQTKKK